MTYLAILTFVLLFPDVTAQEYIHRDFDWEGDDDGEGLPGPRYESCYACHYGGMYPKEGYPRKKCQDCHAINISTGSPDGPYKEYNLDIYDNFTVRDDIINEVIVYSHLTVSRPNSTDYSSCLTYDPETGGSCHGVAYSGRENAGNYFAFNDTHSKFPSNEPYLNTMAAVNLPDTTDCIFCHEQRSDDVKKAWGNPPQIGIKHSAASGDWRKTFEKITLQECYECHVENIDFKNFHSPGVYVERKEFSERFGWLIFPVFIVIIVGYLGIKVIRSRIRK